MNPDDFLYPRSRSLGNEDSGCISCPGLHWNGTGTLFRLYKPRCFSYNLTGGLMSGYHVDIWHFPSVFHETFMRVDLRQGALGRT